MAEEALALHIEGMVADGEANPEPASLTAVMSAPENRDGVAILVAVKSAAKKVVRVNVTLPEDVLQQMDTYAEQHGFTRSGFLASAQIATPLFNSAPRDCGGGWVKQRVSRDMPPLPYPAALLR
jgi:hypothetical protein